MSFDFGQYYEFMEQECRRSRDFEGSVLAICEWLEERVPHDDWKKIKALDVAGDLQKAKRWLPEALRHPPCPFVPKAIYFDIAEVYPEADKYGNYGPSNADIYPVVFGDYDSDTSGWLDSNVRHDYDNAHANLAALKEAGHLFNFENDGIGSESYIAHSVGYVVLLLRHLLDSDAYKAIGGDSPIGIATGFSDGDLFCMGKLANDGMQLRQGSMLMDV